MRRLLKKVGSIGGVSITTRPGYPRLTLKLSAGLQRRLTCTRPSFFYEMEKEIPYGYCHCGCGQKAPIAKWSWAAKGIVKGEPKKYIQFHKPRGKRGPQKKTTIKKNIEKFLILRTGINFKKRSCRTRLIDRKYQTMPALDTQHLWGDLSLFCFVENDYVWDMAADCRKVIMPKVELSL